MASCASERSEGRSPRSRLRAFGLQLQRPCFTRAASRVDCSVNVHRVGYLVARRESFLVSS